MKTAKVINVLSKKSVFLDKTSEYYRVCPTCELDFMADHMSRKFCSDKCGDDYNNSKKRLSIPFIETESVQAKPPPPNKVLAPPELNPLQKNLRVLNGLHIDPINGSYFHLEDLDAKGLDFGAIAGRAKLYNIPTEYDCHFIQIGEYRIFRVEYSTVLIVKTNNK